MRLVIAVLGFSLLSWPATVAITTESNDSMQHLPALADLADRLDGTVWLASYDHARLSAWAEDAKQGNAWQIEIGEESYELHMHRNPAFAAAVFVERPHMLPLAGIVGSDPERSARLTIDLWNNSLTGFVEIKDGVRYHVQPEVDGRGPVHMWYVESDLTLLRGEHGHIELPVVRPDAEIRSAAISMSGGAGLDQFVEAPENETLVAPAVCACLATYDSAYIRVFWDNTDPTSIMNMVDDVWSNEMRIKFHVMEVTYLNTDSYPDAECTSGTSFDPFLDRFKQDKPINGNDRAILITRNVYNIDYNGKLGCAEFPGVYAWSQFYGTPYEISIVASHELGHTFNAPHDTTSTVSHEHCSTFGCWWHDHKTIMNDPFAGEGSTTNTFSPSSRSYITTEAEWLRHVAQIWTGSSTSSDNVQLTWWEIRYPRNVRGGSTLELYRDWKSSTGSGFWLDQAFVGARDDSGGNRDFGYLGGHYVQPYSTPTEWVYTLPSGGGLGTWTFWPAYYVNGHYGPYKWQAISISIE